MMSDTTSPQPVGAGDLGEFGKAARDAWAAFLSGDLSGGFAALWRIGAELRKALAETPQVFSAAEKAQAEDLLSRIDAAKAHHERGERPQAFGAKAVAGSDTHAAASLCKEMAEACGCPCDAKPGEPGRTRAVGAVGAIDWKGLLARLAQLLPLILPLL